MPLLSPAWILIVCLLVTAGAALGQELLTSRLRSRLLRRSEGRLYFGTVDRELAMRLAAAMPEAGFPVGAAAVTARHVVIDPEPGGEAGDRHGVCRLDYVVGSVRLRSNRSRAVAFRLGRDAVEIIHVAAPDRPLVEQFEAAFDYLPPPAVREESAPSPTAE